MKILPTASSARDCTGTVGKRTRAMGTVSVMVVVVTSGNSIGREPSQLGRKGHLPTIDETTG